MDKNDFALLSVIPNLQSCKIAPTESESGNHEGVFWEIHSFVLKQFPTPSLFLIDPEVFVNMCTFMPSPKKILYFSGFKERKTQENQARPLCGHSGQRQSDGEPTCSL